MNNDKAVSEMKIFFADFKMLAAKVNDDNKNKKKQVQLQWTPNI